MDDKDTLLSHASLRRHCRLSLTPCGSASLLSALDQHITDILQLAQTHHHLSSSPSTSSSSARSDDEEVKKQPLCLSEASIKYALTALTTYSRNIREEEDNNDEEEEQLPPQQPAPLRILPSCVAAYANHVILPR